MSEKGSLPTAPPWVPKTTKIVGQGIATVLAVAGIYGSIDSIISTNPFPSVTTTTGTPTSPLHDLIDTEKQTTTTNRYLNRENPLFEGAQRTVIEQAKNDITFTDPPGPKFVYWTGLEKFQLPDGGTIYHLYLGPALIERIKELVDTEMLIMLSFGPPTEENPNKYYNFKDLDWKYIGDNGLYLSSNLRDCQYDNVLHFTHQELNQPEVPTMMTFFIPPSSSGEIYFPVLSHPITF